MNERDALHRAAGLGGTAPDIADASESLHGRTGGWRAGLGFMAIGLLCAGGLVAVYAGLVALARAYFATIAG